MVVPSTRRPGPGQHPAWPAAGQKCACRRLFPRMHVRQVPPQQGGELVARVLAGRRHGEDGEKRPESSSSRTSRKVCAQPRLKSAQQGEGQSCHKPLEGCPTRTPVAAAPNGRSTPSLTNSSNELMTPAVGRLRQAVTFGGPESATQASDAQHRDLRRPEKLAQRVPAFRSPTRRGCMHPQRGEAEALHGTTDPGQRADGHYGTSFQIQEKCHGDQAHRGGHCTRVDDSPRRSDATRRDRAAPDAQLGSMESST